MRSAIILAMYLGDSLISVVMPFSSGPFAIAMISVYLGSAKLYQGVAIAAVIWGALTFGMGLFGASYSGTSLSALSFATPILFVAIWIVGAGTHGDRGIILGPAWAFTGVLFSAGFLLLSRLGLDVMSVMKGDLTGRPSGIYFEASHYALYVLPLWLIAFEEKKFRPWLYAALLVQIAVSFSTTLVALGLIAFFVRAYVGSGEKRQSLKSKLGLIAKLTVFLVPTFLASSVINVGTIPVSDYVAKRLYGVLDAENSEFMNLSSLVVVQGVELAHISLSESRGLGVGLGNLGTSPRILDKTTTRALISALLLDGGDLNLRDGGLLVNKLAGELGAQIVLMPIILFLYFKRMKALGNPSLLRYHAAFGSVFLCLLFIRVLPYFSAPTVLAFFSVAAVLNKRPQKVFPSRVSPHNRILPDNPAQVR